MISVLQLQSHRLESLLVVPAGPGLPEPDETAGPFAFRTGNPGVRHAAQSYRPIWEGTPRLGRDAV